MVYCPVSNSSSQKPFVVHGTEGFEPRRADDECDYRKIAGVFLTEPLLYGFKLFKVLIFNIFPLKNFGEKNFYVLNCHGGRTCACSMTKLLRRAI